MESRGFYNEILTEHNLRPEFKPVSAHDQRRSIRRGD